MSVAHSLASARLVCCWSPSRCWPTELWTSSTNFQNTLLPSIARNSLCAGSREGRMRAQQERRRVQGAMLHRPTLPRHLASWRGECVLVAQPACNSTLTLMDAVRRAQLSRRRAAGALDRAMSEFKFPPEMPAGGSSNVTHKQQTSLYPRAAILIRPWHPCSRHNDPLYEIQPAES